VVVFVHGILSSGDFAWGEPSWPELLKQETEFSSIGIYIFTYRTSLGSRTYSIVDVANTLRERLRQEKLLDTRKIVFVCHSMGGIVVRRFLCANQTELLEKKLKIGLFLIASPSLGARDANMLSLLWSVLQHTQAAALRFSGTNTFLDELDQDFRKLLSDGKLLIEGRELTEDRAIPIKRWFGLRRQVVEPILARGYFDKRGCEPLKIEGSDHVSIVKPTRNDALQHIALKQFINDWIIGPNTVISACLPLREKPPVLLRVIPGCL
jgi:hypothetical protein